MYINSVVYQATQQDVPGGPLSQGVRDLTTGKEHVVTFPAAYPIRRMKLSHIWNWVDKDSKFVPERCLMGCSVCKDSAVGLA